MGGSAPRVPQDTLDEVSPQASRVWVGWAERAVQWVQGSQPTKVGGGVRDMWVLSQLKNAGKNLGQAGSLPGLPSASKKGSLGVFQGVILFLQPPLCPRPVQEH